VAEIEAEREEATDEGRESDTSRQRSIEA